MLIDGHNDLAWAMRQQYGADLDAVDLTSVVPGLHTDLKRLEAGGVAGQFWSVYVSPELFVYRALLSGAVFYMSDLVRAKNPLILANAVNLAKDRGAWFQ